MNSKKRDAKKNIEPQELSQEWLKDFYHQVGREVSLARESQRETHNWVITISGGAIASVWALGGGATTFIYPTESSFIVILVLVPLITRFFVRACLEYQIFNRWVALRNALDIYYFSKDIRPDMTDTAMKSLVEQIRLYYFQWKQPQTTKKMLLDNLLLAFGWPFLLISAMLILGIIVQPITRLIIYTYFLVIPWLFFELMQFINYFSGNYQEPLHKIKGKNI